MPHVEKSHYEGDANIGLYAMATDKYAIFPAHYKFDHEVLNVPVIHSTVSRTNFNGIFMVGNSQGLLVSSIIKDTELEHLKKEMQKIAPGVVIHVIDSKNNALGNLIACNDKGAVISPSLREHAKEISKALGVPVHESNIIDTDLAGSFCIATNKGFVLTMNADEKEYDFFKKSLHVNGDIGSVNFGGIFVKSGIIANSNGFLVGKLSTGPEIGRIDEALGFI
jgi:translation initiation factor 6